MNKILLLTIIGLLVFSIGGVSAKTMIAGKIIAQDKVTPVPGANVTVYCTNNKNTTINQSVSGATDGSYAVTFLDTYCNVGDKVIVVAVKGKMSGTGNGIVMGKSNYPGLTVNLAIVNVPTTPEFTFFLGTLTLISAVGIFFVVRKD